MAETRNYLPSIVNRAITRFEDPVGLARPLWRDYSRYQGLVNADVAIANGVLGMAHRATISYGYQDPFFAVNYEAFNRPETYRTSYHVIYPDQPAMRQADNWYRVHPVCDTVPRVIDLELHNNQPISRIAAVTWDLVQIVKDRDGIPPIIYSRYLLVNRWLASWTDMMLNSVWWWLAQYSWLGYKEHAGPPTLPNRVGRDRVILHQTSDHKLAPPGEVKSKAVDWDRWEIGNESQMHQWIKENWDGEIIVPPTNGIIPIDQLRVTASALNMRSSPDATALDIGTLKNGSDVSITKRDGDWGKVEGWIHTGYTEPHL